MSDRKFNFTKARLEAIEPPVKGRSLYRDTKEPRLGISVTVKGTKSFYASATVSGSTRRIAIGQFPATTVMLAREKVTAIMTDLTKGITPASRKYESTTMERFLNRYISDRELKSKTVAGYRETLKAMWPKRYTQPLSKITRDMVLRRYNNMGDRPAQADHGLRALKALFNYAHAVSVNSQGDSPYFPNPTDVIAQTKTRYKIRRRDRLLHPGDIESWWNALHQDKPLIADLLVMILLTGIRKSEAFSLRWDDVDFHNDVFTLHDTKNGTDVTLPLPLHVSSRLMVRKANSTTDWVFGAPSLNKPVVRIEGRCGLRVSPHDLRRTFATTASDIGLNNYAIKGLLNHATSTSDVTDGYINLSISQLQQASLRIERKILELAGVKVKADVIPIKRA